MFMKNQEKVGLSPINWFFSIFGLLICLLLIILPPVFRRVFKEEIKEEPPKEEKKKTFSCSKNLVLENGENHSYQYILGATGDVLETIAYTETANYIEVNQEAVDLCNLNNETYSSQAGIYFSCSISELSITTDARITVGAYLNAIPPFMESFDNQTLTTYQELLTSSNFVCNEGE